MLGLHLATKLEGLFEVVLGDFEYRQPTMRISRL